MVIEYKIFNKLFRYKYKGEVSEVWIDQEMKQGEDTTPDIFRKLALPNTEGGV